MENVVSCVLENTLEREYQKGEEEAVKQSLIEELTLDVGRNGAVEVQVKAIDLKKGILSVEVTERFRQFNGKERSIVCEKTAIVEQCIKQDTISAQDAVSVQKMETSACTAADSVYTNAYLFYQTHGSAMVFEPGENKEGMIYYGTTGKLASSSKIRYENLGWRVTVQDAQGNLVEQVYYSIGGKYMEKVDARDVNNYRYSLYCVSLENLKARLSAKACETLNSPDSAIIFDACITIVKNDVCQGGVLDSGVSWGKVYTTYDGIVNAQNWSSNTKEALKSYYGKTVENMFFRVELLCGDGIAQVSGAGEYCYGTEVTIDAVPKSGYTFSRWSGTTNTVSQKFTFTVYGDVTMTATTSRDDVAINLYRNLNNKDEEMQTMYVSLSGGDYVLQDAGWRRAGYYQTGWSTSRIIASPYFRVEQELSYDWLERIAPSVDLYATWTPNTYIIKFEGNGAVGDVETVNVKYTDRMNLPSEGYEFKDGKLTGWSLSPDAATPEYLCNQETDISELVNRLGLEYTRNAVITLYAFKEANPQVVVRFISGKYYKDAEGKWITEEKGGLAADSLWKTDAEYMKLLDTLFGY